MRSDAGRGGQDEGRPRNLLHVQIVGRVEDLLEVVDGEAHSPPLGLEGGLGHRCRVAHLDGNSIMGLYYSIVMNFMNTY